MSDKTSPVKKVYLVVNKETNELHHNYTTGTRVYTRKGNAVAQCYKDTHKVVEFELRDGVVVYE